jgi:hypothetical protein
MADSRAQISSTGLPCTVDFVLVDNTCIDDRNSDHFSDFDSDDSEGEDDNMENRSARSTVSKKRPYLTTAYYDSKSRPADFPTPILAQRNSGWTANPEAFDR